MVDGAALEKRCAMSTVGSNPTLSATPGRGRLEAYGAALEMRFGETRRGFESPPLRHLGIRFSLALTVSPLVQGLNPREFVSCGQAEPVERSDDVVCDGAPRPGVLPLRVFAGPVPAVAESPPRLSQPVEL